MKERTTIGGEAVRLTASKIITLVITMVTGMLLSRFRTFEEYGTYSQLLLVINLFSSLLMLGLPNSINFFLARADSMERRQHFLSVYYTLSTILSAIMGIVMVLSIPLIEWYFNNPTISSFFYFLALYPWASIISSSIENVLVVYKKTSILIVYRIINSVTMLASVIVIQLLGFGFSVYMIVFVIVNCIFCLYVYIVVSKLSGGIHISIDGKLIRALLSFSIPMGLASLVGTFNTEIDKLLIGFLMDTEQLAIYSNAAKELPLAIVATSITAVLLPQLTRMVKNNNCKQAIELWGYATELSLMIIAAFTLVVFVFAEEVMTILYSAKYLAGVSVFRIYTLNLILRITYFGIMLNAYGKTKQVFYCSIASLIANTILNPLFYFVFGVVGPAIATFASILLILLLQLKMTSKVTGVSFGSVFPWKSSAVIIIINSILALLFYFIKKAVPMEKLFGEIVESVLLGSLWMIVYVFLMRNRLKDRWHKLNKGGASEDEKHD